MLRKLRGVGGPNEGMPPDSPEERAKIYADTRPIEPAFERPPLTVEQLGAAERKIYDFLAANQKSIYSVKELAGRFEIPIAKMPAKLIALSRIPGIFRIKGTSKKPASYGYKPAEKK